MRIVPWAHYQIPKSDRSLAECEDAWTASSDWYVLALADGASQGVYSRLWARLLVDSFVERPTLAIDAAWVAPVARRFVESIFAGPTLPWYVAAKLARGTFATLLGVIFDKNSPTFSAVAVGDSCLAWHGPDGQGGIFPATSVADIALYPFLVSTLPECNVDLSIHATTCHVTLPPGETFLFLMTDALARWYLNEFHEGREPWKELLLLADESAFSSWACHKLQCGHLQDDDLTLVIIRVEVEGDQDPHADAQVG